MSSLRRLASHFVLLTITGCVSARTGVSLSGELPWAERYRARDFPSVFAAWSPIEGDESTDAWCRHDLIWRGPESLGLRFNDSHIGLASGFDPTSVAVGLAHRAELLRCNPHLVLVAEIRYRDAPDTYLPKDSPWWKRDERGVRIAGWEEGGYYLLDFSRSDFRRQVALQCQAAVASGVFDGCFFDWWWHEDDERIALIREVRGLVGNEALLIVNVNGRRPLKTARYVNGIYMEGFGARFFSDWRTAMDNFDWASRSLREPALTAFEAWASHDPRGPGRRDAKALRRATILSLVFSDGSVLFGDPNSLPKPDHLHDWSAFWERGLGSARGIHVARPDGSYAREFDRGTVVFNPPENRVVFVDFLDERLSRATGRRAHRFEVSAGDGDIFLRVGP